MPRTITGVSRDRKEVFARISEGRKEIDALIGDGWQMGETRLATALIAGDIKEIDRLVDAGATLGGIAWINNGGKKGLHQLAMEHNQVAAAQHLISRGLDPNEPGGLYGSPPLGQALDRLKDSHYSSDWKVFPKPQDKKDGAAAYIDMLLANGADPTNRTVHYYKFNNEKGHSESARGTPAEVAGQAKLAELAQKFRNAEDVWITTRLEPPSPQGHG